MRKVTLVLILLTSGIAIFAQNKNELVYPRPFNSIDLNLLGDASIISINYDRQFLVSPSFILSGKIGLGYNQEFQLCVFGPCSSPPHKYLTITHHITGNFGKGRHFFEFGLGGTIIIGNTTQPYLLYPIIGYRFLPLRSDKLNFRIFGQIPLTGLETDDIMFLPFGLSLGISF